MVWKTRKTQNTKGCNKNSHLSSVEVPKNGQEIGLDLLPFLPSDEGRENRGKTREDKALTPRVRITNVRREEKGIVEISHDQFSTSKLRRARERKGRCQKELTEKNPRPKVQFSEKEDIIRMPAEKPVRN